MPLSFDCIIQGEVPVVVDFFSECCESHVIMQSILHQVKTIAGSMVTVLKMNISKNEFYANKYHIKSVPTVMIFKNGNILWRKSGLASTQEIIQCLAININ